VEVVSSELVFTEDEDFFLDPEDVQLFVFNLFFLRINCLCSTVQDEENWEGWRLQGKC